MGPLDFLNFLNKTIDKLEDLGIGQSHAERMARKREKRIKELKEKFVASGEKQNFADTDEVGNLLQPAELDIIKHCQRQKCHGCSLGWICPKYDV